MTISAAFGALLDRVADRVDLRRAARRQTRNDASSIAEWILRSQNIDQIRYPAFHFAFMREWHTRRSVKVDWMKRGNCSIAESAHRFTTLVDELGSNVPSPPLAVAQTLARAADAILDRREGMAYERWAADVGLHFQISSVDARRGRLLCAAIRFLRPSSVLELGTAYGMSSLCMGTKLVRLDKPWSIITVEMNPRTHAIASGILNEAFSGKVNCICGTSQSALQALRETNERFDFFFHDAAHSLEAYTRDFAAAAPMLQPGAVLLLDDIRWENEKFHAGGARTYEGWREIVNHPRVAMAVELDESMGLALLN